MSERVRTAVFESIVCRPLPRTRGGVRLVLFVLCLAAPVASVHGAFVRNEIESGEGYFQIEWEADAQVRLLESTSPEFADAVTVYLGSDTGRVVSGKPDGIWYYRLESADSGRVLGSDLTVTVRHHPLSRAFAFFALGIVVFVSTLGLIVFGRAREP